MSLRPRGENAKRSPPFGNPPLRSVPDLRALWGLPRIHSAAIIDPICLRDPHEVHRC